MIYAHSPIDSPRGHRPFQFRLWTLLAGVTVFCVFAGWLADLAYRGVTTSLDAENTLQAYTRTLDALTRFVQATGRWPKSWEEFAGANPVQRGGLLDWPKGIGDLQSRVTINFQLDLKDIEAMTPETFSAVEQAAPNYGPEDARVRALLNAVRSKRAAMTAH
jgi:hypothetical protein